MNIHSTGEALRRREEIGRIVRETPVHSQDELLAHLRKRGYRVTQPTLSRDLRELGLVKMPTGYVAPADLAAPLPFVVREVRENRLDGLLEGAVLFAEAAGNLVVIKTPAAAAQPVASAIDAASLDDALGTIGGDDTIFVAFRHPAAAVAFARRIQQIASLSPSRRRSRA